MTVGTADALIAATVPFGWAPPFKPDGSPAAANVRMFPPALTLVTSSSAVPLIFWNMIRSPCWIGVGVPGNVKQCGASVTVRPVAAMIPVQTGAAAEVTGALSSGQGAPVAVQAALERRLLSA